MNITAKASGGKRRQIQLPIPWHFDNAKKIGEAVCKIYDDFSSGIELELAAKKISFSSPEEEDRDSDTNSKGDPSLQTDWNELIERYREHKIRSGEIKASTWTRVHRHHMKLVSEAVTSRQPPRSAVQLPDQRWRLGFKLMAAYGLRPEELQHLQLRDRDGRLRCTYEKVASRGKTKPRALRLLPCDGWAADWKLTERFSPDDLPPMRAGFGGDDFEQYLRRRSLWEKLRQEYEAKGEKLVPYSCRHGYAHRAHVICDLPPKMVAAAMGHSVQTHLAAYRRWCGDDAVDDAFAKAERHLCQGLHAQSSAA